LYVKMCSQHFYLCTPDLNVKRLCNVARHLEIAFSRQFHRTLAIVESSRDMQRTGSIQPYLTPICQRKLLLHSTTRYRECIIKSSTPTLIMIIRNGSIVVSRMIVVQKIPTRQQQHYRRRYNPWIPYEPVRAHFP